MYEWKIQDSDSVCKLPDTVQTGSCEYSAQGDNNTTAQNVL